MVFPKLFSMVLGALPRLFILMMCLSYNFTFGQSYVLIDSSGNGYTLLGQDRECIAYSRQADAIVIVNRAYLSTGALNVHSAPGDLSVFHHDFSVYNQVFGPARNPYVYADDDAPYITFTYLIAGQPGGVGGQYESGGWFSSFWDEPVDIGPGDIDANKIYLKKLPNENMHFVIHTTNGTWLYRIYSPDLGYPIASGVYPCNNWKYWGSDCNDTLLCVGFYKFFEPESVYRVILFYTPTNADTWDLAIPSPYPPCIEYTQLALIDSSLPLLVFNWRDLSDSTYPYLSKIYVSYASGVPPVELTAVLPDTEATYPTIATGGGKAVVIFNIPRNNTPDSLTWMDIYMCISSDNGLTWSAPINITPTSTFRFGLQQIAKRIDLIRNRIYYVFARDKVVDHDPLWHLLYDPIGLDAMDIFLGYTPLTGIKVESIPQIQKSESLELKVYPDIIKVNAQVKYIIPKKQKMTLNLYDIVGRKIAPISEGFFEPGAYTVNHNFSELSSGTYFLILEGEKEIRTQKILILR